MNITRIMVCVSALLLAAAVVPRARADAWNQKTIFTFSGPVEIPGRVLPAGTYVFKLADSLSDRNIIEVYNKNETHLYGIFLAIPDYRLEPTGKTVVTFRERAENSPEAVKAWFYPGDEYGHEFVYPKVKALQLAKANNETVPAMPNELAAKTTMPTTSMNQPNVTALKQAPLKAEQPNQQEVEVAQAFPPSSANREATPPPATTQAQTTVPQRLPKTGSSLPLIGLLGLLSIGTAGTLRQVARRMK